MVMISYLVHYITLLQNPTDVITKCDKSLLQNVSAFLLQKATVLLQNVTVITKCDVHNKICQHTPSSFLPSILSPSLVYEN